jgi:hypothetical protein
MTTTERPTALDPTQLAAAQPASRTFGYRGDKKPAKKTKDLKGHEALLRGLEASGAEVTIAFRDSEDEMTGTVKHSDPYTVSIGRPDGSTYVVFKHAMIGFKVAARTEV